MVLFGQRWFYSGKVVVFQLGGCIRTKVVVFWQDCFIRAVWLYSGKSGCIRAEVVIMQNGCNGAKAIVIGQSVCVWAAVAVFGQSGCIRAKVVVLRQIG